MSNSSFIAYVRGNLVAHPVSTRQRSKLWSALICLFALLTAACGSTLSPESQDRIVQGAGTFVSGTGATSTIPPGAHVNKEGEVVNAQGEVIGTVSDGGASVASSGDSSSGSQPEAQGGDPVASSGYTEGGNEFGPGVTRTDILVGQIRQSDQNRGCSTIGACGPVAETRGLSEDFADWYNKHGGIAGRKIKLITYEYSSADGTSEQISQRICTYFTQDHPVFAGIGIGDENFNRCANNGGVSLIGGKWTSLDSESFHANPYVYLAGGTNLTNAGLVQAKGLLGSDYFKKPSGAKVGLLTYDEPGHLRAAAEFEKALAAGGVEIDLQQNIYHYSDYSDLGRMDAEVQNAVLKFNTEGITHVMFLQADAAAMPLFFMRHAQDQNYFPRYG
ncbi:MAG: ABC transporter substrate-binding protein, partial [Actinobacteria bacterium]|nr:ABC transporter substrate-binding protein [Actinomycetota bacterium]